MTCFAFSKVSFDSASSNDLCCGDKDDLFFSPSLSLRIICLFVDSRRHRQSIQRRPHRITEAYPPTERNEHGKERSCANLEKANHVFWRASLSYSPFHSAWAFCAPPILESSGLGNAHVQLRFSGGSKWRGLEWNTLLGILLSKKSQPKYCTCQPIYQASIQKYQKLLGVMKEEKEQSWSNLSGGILYNSTRKKYHILISAQVPEIKNIYNYQASEWNMKPPHTRAIKMTWSRLCEPPRSHCKGIVALVERVWDKIDGVTISYFLCVIKFDWCVSVLSALLWKKRSLCRNSGSSDLAITFENLTPQSLTARDSWFVLKQTSRKRARGLKSQGRKYTLAMSEITLLYSLSLTCVQISPLAYLE